MVKGTKPQIELCIYVYSIYLTSLYFSIRRNWMHNRLVSDRGRSHNSDEYFRAGNITTWLTSIKSHTSHADNSHSDGEREVDVSILSLFKCVCRIILTSYTQAKRARVHPCSRASAVSLRLFLSIYASVPFSPSLSLSLLSYACDTTIYILPSFPYTYRCVCVKSRTYIRVKTGRTEGASESNRVVCLANDARRRDDFLPGRMNAKVSYLETRWLANSVTDTSRLWICMQYYFIY